MPNEFRSGDVPRSEPREDRSQVDIEVSRSRFHAQQAIGLVDVAHESADPEVAAVHAALSIAAATRALALIDQEVSD